MQWRILNIEPGENPDDVIVRVGYYYNEMTHRKRVESSADFVEDHVIRNIIEKRPKKNYLGQIVMKDGTTISPFIEIDGDWHMRDLSDLEEDIDWLEPTDAEIEAAILAPLKNRAERVMENPPSVGVQDVFEPGEKPSEKGTPNPNAIARRQRVIDLFGYNEVH